MKIQATYPIDKIIQSAPANELEFSSIKAECTAAQAAMIYLKHGLSPVPVPHGQKNPMLPDWPHFKCSENEVLLHFGGQKNVSVLTGAASGGLIDIDLDCPSTIALASKFLPPTNCVFGRSSKPASHYIYRVEGPTESSFYQISAPGIPATLLEYRGDKHLTVFPPAVHSNEPVRFEVGKCGLPTKVSTNELQHDCTLLGCTALISEIWPKVSGSRQELALAIAGGLLNRLSVSDAERVLGEAAKYAGDEEHEKRRAAVNDTDAKKKAATKTTGWPKAAKLIGENGAAVVAALRQWLGDDGPSDLMTANLTMASDIEPKPTEWLWKGWLALGTVSLLDGDPGQGKSTISLDLAARLSAGLPFPDGSPCSSGGVIIIGCEDIASTTIVPRLMAAGANLKKLGIRQQLSIPEELPKLKQNIIDVSARLVIIDPLMAFLGGKVNVNNDHHVRSALSPLAKLAEDLNVSILCIRHFSKQPGRSAMHKGGGSIGLIGAARSAMLVAKNPHDAGSNVLAMVKSNLAARPQSLRYRVAQKTVSSGPGHEWEVNSIDWLGTSDLNADQLVAEPTPHQESALASAKEYILDILKDGPMNSTDVQSKGKEAGHSKATFERASKELAGEKKIIKKKSAHAGWYWSLNPSTPS